MNPSFQEDTRKTTKTFFAYKQTKADYASAPIVILPIPYEGTVSYGRGAKNGPHAIIAASHQVESYNHETNKELCKEVRIFTLPSLMPALLTKPEHMIANVYKKAKTLLKDKKFICTLGGEHTVSLGVIRAYAEQYPKLSVLHIDAHADMRRTYHGTPYSHACVMYHLVDTVTITQVGIRSLAQEEMNLIKEKNINVFFADNVHDTTSWINDVLQTLHDNVYVTIDVDGFDPSVIPATGTPEPGGLTWHQVIHLLKRVAQKRTVVGFDIVELAPQKGIHGSDYICAKLCYTFLSYIFS